MAKESFLAWLVVIRRDEQRAIGAEFFGHYCVGHGVMGGVRTGAGQDLATFVRDCDRKPDRLLAFIA